MQPIITITPDWPAPKHIRAYSTTRIGGVSQGAFASLNLGDHVDDNQNHVMKNRCKLIEALALPESHFWLKQTHSTTVISAEHANKQADAVYTQQKNHICCVMTADCLPILICNQKGTQVAAIHAGWRGLANGIIENTLEKMAISGKELLAWLGPAISQKHFEVGDEVRTLFIKQNPLANKAFIPSENHRWLADIYALAKLRLQTCEVNQIFGDNFCTFSDSEKFFSYRRDGVTGRMASFIFLE